MKRPPYWPLIPLLACVAFAAGCDSSESQAEPGAAPAGTRQPPSGKPNILLAVWDTVRADHLSLYGWHRRTTPYVDEWASGARVFENCVSAGSTTVPAHASMFTGLLPTEHRTDNQDPRLADEFETLAELLQANGYGTYMFSENPHICERNNFTQGFDVVEYPWSPQYIQEALRITREKTPPQDRTSSLPERVRNGQGFGTWSIKACGELAQKGVENWLPLPDPQRPFFVFLNYMEAHRPLIPPRKYRRQIMTPEQVRASYLVDRKWVTLWSYVFGRVDYTPQDIELTSATYDATLRELDDLFHTLLEFLRSSGNLENTVVVLVGDHGEHLGEHHLLDHQFSVYEPLMRVPLVVHYPARFAPGREQRPVSNMDLYPTLLELAGIEPPIKSKAVSLLRPRETRPRMGEYPAVMTGTFKKVLERYPDFDPTPWRRTLRAYYDEPYKFIQASDGRHELYRLDDDPDELQNLFRRQPQAAERLAADLQAYLDSLLKIATTQPQGPPLPVDLEDQRRLEALGYISTSQAAPDDDDSSDSGGLKQEDDEP